MKNGDMPAMPNDTDSETLSIVHSVNNFNDFLKFRTGLTKREMFAMHFMGHLCDVYLGTVSEYDSGKQLIECQAETAIEMADILLAKLEKTNEEQ